MQATLDPQLAAAYQLAAEQLQALGPPPAESAAAREHAVRARAWWNEGGPAMHAVEEHAVAGPLRPIPIVVYRPVKADAPQPAYVYLHGGGFRFGTPRANDRQMREIAAAWGGIVVSADYAHVPEHVFPAAVEECCAVYRHLAAQGATLGIDGTRLAFGGSSAGANVAVGAAIQLGAEGAAHLRAGACVVGLFDDDADTESMRLYGDAGLPPGRQAVAATLANYVPDARLRQDPRVNCVLADPTLLPPMFLAAAEMDTLRDSSRKMAARLADAGRPCVYKEYPGMGHLFFGHSRTVARAAECVADVAGFLRDRLPPG
jgi:acetyl esterase